MRARTGDRATGAFLALTAALLALTLVTELPPLARPRALLRGSVEPVSRSLTIDKGSADGLLAGMVVASPAGLVGRIVELSPHSALVQTLADPQSRVNAYGALSGLEGTVMGDGSTLTIQVPARPD